jgi:hypothetical protein
VIGSGRAVAAEETQNLRHITLDCLVLALENRLVKSNQKVVQKLNHKLLSVNNGEQKQVAGASSVLNLPVAHLFIKCLDKATHVLADQPSGTEAGSVQNGERISELGVGTLESPLGGDSELLVLTEFLLVFLFVLDAHFFQNFEATLLNLLVLIKQSRQQVGEEATLMVNLVR